MLFGCHQNLGRSVLIAHLQKWNIIGCVANRTISESACCRQQTEDYYDSLGVPRNSTQRDIKAAYYKLSMQFHPDKNQGSDHAAQKFREISKAYEVLGNYKSKRLYDKGVGAGFGPMGSEPGVPRADEIVPDDDDETKFYKSRFRKTSITTDGRSPIYDFDEWSRAHYGKTFDRRQTAKHKFERKQNEKSVSVTSLQNEFVLFGLVFGLIAALMIFQQESTYDKPAQHYRSKPPNNK